ncbi:MAG: hypothetical protein IPM45_06465 [Acidimicrobiales bacterium]|nr:hypothetical protein [Acidimicrobiales bacterium]
MTDSTGEGHEPETAEGAERPEPEGVDAPDTVGQAPASPAESPEEELARLRAEVAALRAGTQAPAPPQAEPRAERHGHPRLRVTGAVVLLVVGSLLAVLANVGLWTRNVVLDTDTYVDTVAALPQNPEVARALAVFSVDELFTQVDVEQKIEDALPEDFQFLTGPAESAVRGFAEDAATTVIQSNAFDTIWTAAQRQAHGQARGLLLDGNGVLVTTSGGELQLRLGALVNATLDELGTTGRDLFSNLDIPDDVGTVTVAENDTIRQARTAVQTLNWSPLLLVLLSLLCFAGTVALWPRHRRGLVAVCIGVIVVMGLTLFAIAVGQAVGVSRIDDPTYRAGAEAALGILDQGLAEQTRTLLLLALLVGVIAVVTGPAPWAVRARAAVRDGAADLWRRLGTPENREQVVGAAATYKVPIRIGIATIGVIVLVFFTGISLTSILVVAALVALALIGAEALASSGTPAEEGTAAAGAEAPAGGAPAGAIPVGGAGRRETALQWMADHRVGVRVGVIGLGLVLLLLVGLSVGNLIVIALFVGLALLGLEVAAVGPAQPPPGPGGQPAAVGPGEPAR